MVVILAVIGVAGVRRVARDIRRDKGQQRRRCIDRWANGAVRRR